MRGVEERGAGAGAGAGGGGCCSCVVCVIDEDDEEEVDEVDEVEGGAFSSVAPPSQRMLREMKSMSEWRMTGVSMVSQCH